MATETEKSPVTMPKYPDVIDESAGSLSSDEAGLASLGYKQEFKREFGLWTTFSLSFSVMGLLSSFASVMVYGLMYGGRGGQSILVIQVARRSVESFLCPLLFAFVQEWHGDGYWQ